VIGPSLAGVLIVLVGTGPVFLINAASFGAVIFALTRMRPSELMPMPRSPGGRGQLLEGMINGDQILVAFASRQIDALERHMHHGSAAAALGATAAGDVDQDPPHHLCGHTKKVTTVLPPHLVPPKQPEAQLIDQRGRLK